MLNFDQKEIESKIDLLSKCLAFAFKLVVGFGAIFFLAYCAFLTHFPSGVTAGDTLAFIFLAMGFGFLYSFFLYAMYSVGVIEYFLLRLFVGAVVWVLNRRRKEKIVLTELVTPNFLNVGVALVGVVFIVAISLREPKCLLTLPATAFSIDALVLLYQWASKKLREKDSEKDSETDLSSASPKTEQSKEYWIQVKIVLAALIVVLPLLISGASFILVEGGMRWANIRKDSSYVILRAPYSKLIPVQFQSKASPKPFPLPDDYEIFEHIDVMFSGIGTTTVIQFNVGDKIQPLEIPNDSIIIIPKQNSAKKL